MSKIKPTIDRRTFIRDLSIIALFFLISLAAILQALPNDPEAAYMTITWPFFIALGFWIVTITRRAVDMDEKHAFAWALAATLVPPLIIVLCIREGVGKKVKKTIDTKLI